METTLDGRAQLAAWIERSQLQQVEAARIIGMDKAQLCGILKGSRTPGLHNAIKIQERTGVPVHAWVSIPHDHGPMTKPRMAVTRSWTKRKRQVA